VSKRKIAAFSAIYGVYGEGKLTASARVRRPPLDTVQCPIDFVTIDRYPQQFAPSTTVASSISVSNEQYAARARALQLVAEGIARQERRVDEDPRIVRARTEVSAIDFRSSADSRNGCRGGLAGIGYYSTRWVGTVDRGRQ
jgi:hypothetical protein